MIFRIFSFDNDIVIDENSINVLEIHDKSFAVKIIKKIMSNENIFDDEFLVLLDSGKEINIQKNTIIITDFFNINLNDRKLLNRLYDLLEEDIKNDDSLYNEINEVNRLLINLLKDKINYSNFNLEIDEDLNIKELIKAYNVKFQQDNENHLLDYICNYIDIISELNLFKLVFLVNIKSYLNNKQLKELYKYILYKKVNVLVIEMNQYEKFENEKKLVIDEFFDDYYV